MISKLFVVLYLPMVFADVWNGVTFDITNVDENPCTTGYRTIALRCPDGSVERYVFRDPNADPICSWPPCVQGIGTVEVGGAEKPADCDNLQMMGSIGVTPWYGVDEETRIYQDWVKNDRPAGDLGDVYHSWGEEKCHELTIKKFEGWEGGVSGSGGNYGPYYHDFNNTLEDCYQMNSTTNQEKLDKIACWCKTELVGRHKAFVYTEESAGHYHPYSKAQGGTGVEDHPLNGLTSEEACCVCGGGQNKNHTQRYTDFKLPEVIIDCQEDETNCNTKCVSLQTDMDNCGACSNVCVPGTVCLSGLCQKVDLCSNGIHDKCPVWNMSCTHDEPCTDGGEICPDNLCELSDKCFTDDDCELYHQCRLVAESDMVDFGDDVEFYMVKNSLRCAQQTQAPTTSEPTTSSPTDPPVAEPTEPPVAEPIPQVYILSFTAGKRYNDDIHGTPRFNRIIKVGIAEGLAITEPDLVKIIGIGPRIDRQTAGVDIEWYIEGDDVSVDIINGKFLEIAAYVIRNINDVQNPDYMGLNQAIIKPKITTLPPTALTEPDDENDNLPIIIGASVGGVVIFAIAGYFLWPMFSGGTVAGSFGSGI